MEVFYYSHHLVFFLSGPHDGLSQRIRMPPPKIVYGGLVEQHSVSCIRGKVPREVAAFYHLQTQGRDIIIIDTVYKGLDGALCLLRVFRFCIDLGAARGARKRDTPGDT